MVLNCPYKSLIQWMTSALAYCPPPHMPPIIILGYCTIDHPANSHSFPELLVLGFFGTVRCVLASVMVEDAVNTPVGFGLALTMMGCMR